MEMRFQSKEESNRQQRADFLKLSPAERFQAFLELSKRSEEVRPCQRMTYAPRGEAELCALVR